jgi:hypothetical protein
MPTTQKNLDGYAAPPIEWSRVGEVLADPPTQAPGTGGPGRHTTWLTTINPDGSPHVMPVGIVGFDNTWYFVSGPKTRKSRNLARDNRCVVAVATDPLDLIIEGTADRVSAAEELEVVAAAFRDGGWPAVVDGQALTAEFMAPSGGPPPWHVYRVAPATAFALGTAEPFGATKFGLK